MAIEAVYIDTSPQRREQLWLDPLTDFETNRELIYSGQVDLTIGWHGETLFAPYRRPNTEAVVGAAFGDEGKGAFIDKLILAMLKRPGIKTVVVDRYQGGSNAGHSLEYKGLRLALHQVPSFVMYADTIGIMDKGEVIHPEDLQTEVEYIEAATHESLEARLYLSEYAILCSDLERAEEVFNRVNNEGSNGGTGRGISPSYAHFLDRTGFTIQQLMADNWQERFGDRYDDYAQKFRSTLDTMSLKELADVEVPDFRGNTREGKKGNRTLGSKEVFLERLRETREWLIARNLVTNTELLHRRIHQDPSIGILFEGSQAAGLDAYNGTRPDVTSSDTTLTGIKAGTGHWIPANIAESYAVIKLPYTSSVGSRRNPTHVNASTAIDADEDQQWAAWVQKIAHEYGTTTGRPRDIDIIDWEMLRYNLRIAGAEKVVGTHLDIARVDQHVKVCTHYTYTDGSPAFYQPNQDKLNEVIPHYIELPGWDGEACRSAKTFEELPINAQRYLMLMQASLGYPIVAVTTGPDRDNLITFPGFTEEKAA